jgi:hypothetical protein
VRVKANINGRTFWQLREITAGNGFASSPLVAHFGLGNATNIDLVRVEWPSGIVQEFHEMATKQVLTITEPSRLTTSLLSSGRAGITLRSWTGIAYVLEASPDFRSWTPIQTNTTAGLSLDFEDAEALKFDHRFYRARWLQP